jgi:hypothetical protein
MGRIEPGAHPVELGIPARPFVEEARKRGLNITERVSIGDDPSTAVNAALESSNVRTVSSPVERTFK